jgi:hypothetical protein
MTEHRQEDGTCEMNVHTWRSRNQTAGRMSRTNKPKIKNDFIRFNGHEKFK